MPLSVPGSTVPRPKIAAVERRKACALGSSARCRVQTRRRFRDSAFRRSASLGFGETRDRFNPRVLRAEPLPRALFMTLEERSNDAIAPRA